MRFFHLASLLSLTLAWGCSPSSSGSSGSGAGGGSSSSTAVGSGGASSNSNNTTGQAGSTAEVDLPSQVEDCSGDSSRAEVDANLELVASLDSSVHELVACGGLTVRVVGTLVQGVIEMLASNEDDITPDGLMYEGEGTYRAGGDDPNQDTDMLIRFYDDASGELVPIEDDVFLAATYLVGASAEATVEFDEDNPLNSYAVVEISYDSVGPQVERLGFGAEPPNPIVIESSELGSLGLDVDSLVLETTVTVVDSRGDSEVRYDVETGPDPVLGVFDNSRLDYRILDLNGDQSDTGQELSLAQDGWQIEFAGGNRLDGSITFTVTGGAFDYSGVFEYASTSYADIELSCGGG